MGIYEYKQRQEIIDYLEQGYEKYSDLIIRELDRLDITSAEKRTYSSLLDAMLAYTELYCYMTEWPDNVEVFIPKMQSNTETDDEVIIIQHGFRTLDKAKELSDYVKCLPLNNSQNDELIKLMKDQLLIAEHETYIQGFVECMKAVQEGGFKGLEDKIVRTAKIKIKESEEKLC